MGKRKADFQEQVLPIINTALATGKIYNVDIKPITSYINRALEDAFDAYWYDGYRSIPYEERDAAANEISRMDWNYLHIAPTNLKKVTKLQKTHPDNEDIKRVLLYLEEIIPLADAIKSIKQGKIIKGRKVSDEPVKQRYTPPPAKQDDLKRVQDVLNSLTEKFRKKLEGNHIDQQNNAVNLYKKKRLEEPGETRLFRMFPRDGGLKMMLQPLVDARGNVRADVDKIIKEKAERYAEEVLSTFIFKNMSKLTTIIGGKGNLKEVKLLRSNFGNRGMEGSLKLSFEDGSSFEVDTKTVFGISSGGRWTGGGKEFVRYPTTFHAVILPDGSTLKSPSEKKMNTIFLGVATS